MILLNLALGSVSIIFWYVWKDDNEWYRPIGGEPCYSEPSITKLGSLPSAHRFKINRRYKLHPRGFSTIWLLPSFLSLLTERRWGQLQASTISSAYWAALRHPSTSSWRLQSYIYIIGWYCCRYKTPDRHRLSTRRISSCQFQVLGYEDGQKSLLYNWWAEV